jgi:hypothetical protein
MLLYRFEPKTILGGETPPKARLTLQESTERMEAKSMDWWGDYCKIGLLLRNLGLCPDSDEGLLDRVRIFGTLVCSPCF